MTCNFDPREGEIKEAFHAGKMARRNGLPRHRPDDLIGRESWGWDMGWDNEDNWIENGGIEGVMREAAE